MNTNLVHTFFLSLITLGFSWSSSTAQDASDARPEAARPATWAQPVQLEGVPNFHKINERLYRSAQPTAAGMIELKQLGIKTVLNLRAFHSDADEIGQTDLQSRQIGMLAWYPQRQEAIDFLKLVTAADQQPVLVHCQHGADRTGAMIALYRIAVDGWTKEEALREMTAGGYGFHAIWFNLPQWIRDLDIDALCREAGLKPPPSHQIPKEMFVIEVIDAETERGVPLVELETIAHNRFVTDSAGRATIMDKDLLGRKVYFNVRSHGYRYPTDGFGLTGLTLEVAGGQKATVKMQRQNLAERMYRMTGSGIFIDSVQAELMSSETPLVPGDVVGCDSVMTAQYRDKIYWFWGDTNRPHYPLGGNFHITGATTASDLRDTIDQGPPKFDYFVDQQSAIRSVAHMPGDGPTWISAVTVLPGNDPAQSPRMLANYIKVRNQLEAYRWGFVVWDDRAEQFVEVKSTDQRPKMVPEGQVHTFVHEGFVYMSHPWPLTRVAANETDFLDPTQYEGYTCLRAGTTWADKQLDRDPSGRLQFGWKKNTPPLTQKEERKLLEAGLLKPSETRLALKEAQSGRPVEAHTGSVFWNKYRQRWLMIAVEIGGESSLLGDVWLAEATAPEGPWLTATKVLTHDKYSFYNPKHHPFLDSADGRIIYFEGTYTTTFSGNTQPTPRYDYNQILYRLDLDKLPPLAERP